MESNKPQENKFDIKEFLNDYLFPTISLILLILILSLVTVPTINKISAHHGEILLKEDELKELEAFLDRMEELSNESSKLLQDNIVLDKYLPKNSSMSSFLYDIDEMAGSVGLESSELEGEERIQEDKSLEEDDQNDKPHRVFATFNYKGDFGSVYRLFEELNKFKGLLSVESVSFKSNRNNWEVEIKVASYNLPQEVLDNIIANYIDSKSLKLLPSIDENLLDLVEERVDS